MFSLIYFVSMYLANVDETLQGKELLPEDWWLENLGVLIFSLISHFRMNMDGEGYGETMHRKWKETEVIG